MAEHDDELAIPADGFWPAPQIPQPDICPMQWRAETQKLAGGPSWRHLPGLAALVPLIYRADWSSLSLSATLTSWTDNALRTRMLHAGRRHPPPGPEPGPPVTEVSYQVLLAPGGRYRTSSVRDGARVAQGCDGDTAWTVSPAAPGAGGLARVTREKPGPWPVLDDPGRRPG